MKKITCLLFVALVFGCSKEINSVPSNVISASNLQNAAVANTFLPLTKGTYWNYKITTDGKTADSKLTVLSATKKINNKTYQTVQSVDGGYKDIVYYAQEAHNYYIYTNSDGNKIEILFLKDNADKGVKWTTSAGNASGFSLTCHGSISEINLTKKIAGTTYKNVIHSHVDITATIFFFPLTVYSQDYYVAKGVGIINNISIQKYPSTSNSTTNITGYLVK